MKRDYQGNSKDGKTGGEGGRGGGLPLTALTPMFEVFRDELDQHHDRRERIIKASRDVTASSKKIIFALQRVKELNKPIPPAIASQVETHESTIRDLLASVAPDLQGINRYRYDYQLRGLEELVEAVAMRHYLTTQTVCSSALVDTAMLPEGLALTPQDYLYGVFDLFGEMMRFATVLAARDGTLSAAGKGADDDDGESGKGRSILEDMHCLGSAMEMLPEVAGKTFASKLEAMRASVQKVERLGYGIAIRGGERPRGWMPDMADDGGNRPISPV